MKIRGRFGKNGLGFINCHVICHEPPFITPIRFVVDTGASYTSIADKDALRLGLDYSKLEKSQKVIGVGGTAVEAFLLKGINIIFRDSKSSYYVEKLSEIRVLKHTTKNEQQNMIVNLIPSLLGIDILKNYEIKFNKNGVIIEK